MSYQEKNITVSLASFTLILSFFVIRMLQMIQGDSFTSSNVFHLWVIVIVLSIVVVIVATILTHIGSGIVEAIKTGKEPEMNDFADERDKLIDLRGTRITYTLYSLGVFLAMLSFVFKQPPLVMFSLLIFFGLVAQVIGDISRLYLYRRGF